VTENLDRDAWMQMHAAIWGRQWENGELLRISSATPGRNDFGGRGAVQAGDADGAWSIIERYASRGQQTYLQVAVQNASAITLPEPERGKKVDVASIPALVVDLDVRSGVHSAGDRNPTMDEVDGWLDQYPLGRPTVLLHTGGGLHAWYALDTPVDPVSELGEELRVRHKTWWKAVAAAADRNIDSGVLADVTRVLRPAGTINFKASPLPVAIRELNDIRYTAEQILAALPAIERKTRSARAPKTDRERIAVTARDLSVGERAGYRFALGVSVEDVVGAVFGGEMVSREGLSLPDETGMIPQRDAGRLFVGDSGEQRVTWFSTTVQDGFGLDSQEHSHTSFDVLAHGIGGELGYRKASRLVAAWEGHWDDAGFVLAAQAALSPECRAAFAIETPTAVPLPPAKVAEALPVEATSPAAELPPVDDFEARRAAAFAMLIAPAVEPEPVIAPPKAEAVEPPEPEPAPTLTPEPPVTEPVATTQVPAVPEPLPSVVVETGGGVIRLRASQSRHLNNLLEESPYRGRRVVGTDLIEVGVLGDQPGELIDRLRAAGYPVTVSDRDSAAVGCEVRCYGRRALERVDGEWVCAMHDVRNVQAA
jgi:hypothetical protein